MQHQGSLARTVYSGMGTDALSCVQEIFSLGTGISFSCKGKQMPLSKWKVSLQTSASTDLCPPSAALPASRNAVSPRPTSPVLVQDSPLGASAGPGSAGRPVSGPGCARGRWRCPPQTPPRMRRSPWKRLRTMTASGRAGCWGARRPPPPPGPPGP